MGDQSINQSIVGRYKLGACVCASLSLSSRPESFAVRKHGGLAAGSGGANGFAGFATAQGMAYGGRAPEMTHARVPEHAMGMNESRQLRQRPPGQSFNPGGNERAIRASALQRRFLVLITPYLAAVLRPTKAPRAHRGPTRTCKPPLSLSLRPTRSSRTLLTTSQPVLVKVGRVISSIQ